MNAAPLLNPNGKLLEQLVTRLYLARKTKPLWAKRVDVKQGVGTLEGPVHVEPGDYLCRGIQGEYWPQKLEKLLDKYFTTGEFDGDGWQRYNSKPGIEPVEVAQIETEFRVVAQWGELKGKANDYVVRSTSNPTDIWIVDKAIFEASYEAVQ